MNLAAEYMVTLHVTISVPISIGDTGRGNLAIIPITGGHFHGPALQGRVCPGGADWNTRISPDLSHVFAKYWLETDDGHFISIENEGFPDVSGPGAIVKTTPRFQCDLHGKYAFLMRGTFVAELVGDGESAVKITVYRLG